MNLKNKKILQIVASILVLGAVVVVANLQKERNTPTVSTEFMMDTVIMQKLYGKRAPQAIAEIEDRLRQYEKTCSMYIENSEIDLINQNAGKKFVEVSDDTLNMIVRAKEFSVQSNGLFDITIAPLTTLWGITSESPKVPSEQQISQARTLVNYQDILIQNHQVKLKHQGQAIDLGAVAKGAVCNIIREVAQKYNITKGYVSVGGNLIVLKDTPTGSNYRFGIRDPKGDESEYIATVLLNGKTMATSGAYERWFEQDGKRYHHIINPHTGYPAETDLLSVSVISEDGMLADCLSTTFFIEGKQAALAKMQEEEYQLIVVDLQGNVFYSPSLINNLQPNEDKPYQFIAYKESSEKQ